MSFYSGILRLNPDLKDFLDFLNGERRGDLGDLGDLGERCDPGECSDRTDSFLLNELPGFLFGEPGFRMKNGFVEDLDRLRNCGI